MLTVLASDENHMAIVLSQGNSAASAYKLSLTKDGGTKWTSSDVPSTGLRKLTSHGGEYWFAGMEVIEKDKPGGGYGVPLLMHSPDGENWTHLPRWSKHEFSECNSQGCLYWDGAGVQSLRQILLVFGTPRLKRSSPQPGRSQKGQFAPWLQR